ncbi:MAG: BrnA antitoxin family protein [Alcanivoracaceae bacterium]
MPRPANTRARIGGRSCQSDRVDSSRRRICGSFKAGLLGGRGIIDTIHLTRLPEEVIEKWRATGPGWQTRMAEHLTAGPR